MKRFNDFSPMIANFNKLQIKLMNLLKKLQPSLRAQKTKNLLAGVGLAFILKKLWTFSKFCY